MYSNSLDTFSNFSDTYNNTSCVLIIVGNRYIFHMLVKFNRGKATVIKFIVCDAIPMRAYY